MKRCYSKDNPLKLHRASSVVTVEYAREIIWKLGLRARRDGDYLMVFHPEPGDESPGKTLYIKPDEETGQVSQLYVDEGYYSDTLTLDGELLGVNRPWHELVDYEGLLRIIVTTQIEDYTQPSSQAMGHGRRTRDYIHGWHVQLDGLDWVKWVDLAEAA